MKKNLLPKFLRQEILFKMSKQERIVVVLPFT